MPVITQSPFKTVALSGDFAVTAGQSSSGSEVFTGYWNESYTPGGTGFISPGSGGSINTTAVGNGNTIRSILTTPTRLILELNNSSTPNTDATFISFEVVGVGTFTRASGTFSGNGSDDLVSWVWTSGIGSPMTNGGTFYFNINF